MGAPGTGAVHGRAVKLQCFQPALVREEHGIVVDLDVFNHVDQNGELFDFLLDPEDFIACLAGRAQVGQPDAGRS